MPGKERTERVEEYQKRSREADDLVFSDQKEQALEINPKDFAAMRQRGVSLSKKGDEDAAIACFGKAPVVHYYGPDRAEEFRNEPSDFSEAFLHDRKFRKGMYFK